MEAFAALFQGRDDVHGVYRLPRNSSPNEAGKRTGKASTADESVTDDLYQQHLSGKVGLGIVPIRLDGTVRFFVIDVDIYKTPKLHRELAAKIREHSLPLVITRSKSDGAHLWCFLKEPASAADARKVAMSYRTILGLPETVEIFPKQDAIKKADKGSWINLPYFGNTRLGLAEDGTTELSLQGFIEYAHEHMVDPADLKIRKAPTVKEEKFNKDAPPPCIVAMTRDGVEEGSRDKAVLQYAIYARKTGRDDWEDMVKEWADENVTPKMSFAEVSQKIKQAMKGYQYLCGEFTSICNKSTCAKLNHGIGGNSVGGGELVGVQPEFTSLEWVDGEDGHYIVTMYGNKFRVSGAQLTNQAQFRSAFATHVGKLLVRMKNEEWDRAVHAAMETKIVTHAPLETQTGARVVRKWQEWAAQFSKTESLEKAIVAGVPYKNGNVFQFRLNDFVKIAARDFPRATPTQLFTSLKEWGNMLTVSLNSKGDSRVIEYTMAEGETWYEELMKKETEK